MAYLKQQQLHLSMRSCRYTVPNDLSFVGLVRGADAKSASIRFSRDRDITLDIPLSAETLAHLIHALGHMYGTPPERLAEEIEDYRLKGGPVVEG
jgi:hypothetical protein